MPPRKKKRSKAKPEEVFTHCSVRVDRYEVRSEADINYHAAQPHLAFRDIDDELLYQFQTHLEIFGTLLGPKDRAGHAFELTVYGEDRPSANIYTVLKDVHMRDRDRRPMYKRHRGVECPVYWTPKGVGSFDKVRGENVWRSTIFAVPRFVSDWLLMLGQGRELFLSVLEKKVGRDRSLHRIALQTSDPEEE